MPAAVCSAALALAAAACSAPAGPPPTTGTHTSGLEAGPRAGTSTSGPPAGGALRRDPHADVGDLVPGFPVDLLPVPDDAVILVTSAVPVGDAEVREISLTLRTGETVAVLARRYRDALLGHGFTEVDQETAATELAAELVFVRSGADEVVSIGILEDGAGRSVTVGGRIRHATP